MEGHSPAPTALDPLLRASSKEVLAAVQLVLSKPGGSASESIADARSPP